MTSPHSRPLAPLTDLPPPPLLPREDAHLVPPGEIMVDSRRAILTTLLRRLWAPGLVLLGLWYVLVGLYVFGASPAFWSLSLLVAAAEPQAIPQALAVLNFTGDSLAIAFLLVPAAATVLSLLGALAVPRLVAPLQPRRVLSEREFQRTVAARTTAALMTLPVLTVLALPLTVVAGLPQPWTGLGAGPLSCWCLAVLALQAGWVLVRRTVPASRLLGIEDHESLHTTARIGHDPDARRAAAAQVLAQDRRHLPPNPGTPQASRAATPRGAATALLHILRASLAWVVPTAAGLGWMVFGIADLWAVIQGLSSMDLTQVTTLLNWRLAVVAVPVTALVVLGAALAPALAVRLSESQRALVIDQRTYADWTHRARVNPWEARVAGLTGWITAAWGWAGTVLAALLLAVLSASNGMTWSGIVLSALVVVPLLGVAASRAMRTGLRDVLYGPAGDHMRRETPYALVAPEIGTRADRAADPAVRAALRKRLQADGGDHALEIFDLDAAGPGERLWVDDAELGATDTAMRKADLARGRLPDFGSEGSTFTGGGLPASGGADEVSRLHDIPDSVTGLREVGRD